MANTWKSPAAGAALIILLTMVAYLPALHCGYIWDDDFYVTENPTLRSLGGLEAIWLKPGATVQYYPLVFTSFWAEHRLWGLQPFGYHLVNVILHSINAVLLWRVLQRLQIPGSWWAAAIFALHPVNVESVAWVTERKNVLSGLFYLLSMLAYFRFQPLTGSETASARHWRYYPVVLVLFLCALLSKTVTCSLPAVLMLLIWWKNGRLEKRDAVALAPLFVLGITLGLATAWVEKHMLGANGSEWSLSLVQRCLVAGRSLWFYAGKLFWPHQLTFIYPHWEIDAGAAWQYLFPLGVVVVLLALWLMRSQIGRGPLVAVLFFAGTLVPALGFFNVYPFVYSYVADHFQYLASAGLITLIVGVATNICERTSRPGTHVAAVLGPVVLVTLGVLTWNQQQIYRDAETLWQDTITKNPQCSMAHHNLGDALLRRGKVPEAIDQFEQALRIKPDDAETHYNLGIALEQAGRIEEAIAHYQQASQIRPDFVKAHYNLGMALQRTGNIKEAIGHFEQALRIRPDSAAVHYNLGIALEQTGRIEEAVAHYEQALRSRPDFAEAHFNLAVVLMWLGKWPEAVEHFEQALRIRPDSAEVHYYLGIALERTGNVQEGIVHYEQALRIKPDYPKAQNGLAWRLATVTDFGDPVWAVTLAEAACKLTNNRVAAYLDTLAAAYAAAGRFDDAVDTAQKAIQLADSTAQTQLASEIKMRLELYRSDRAYCASENGTGFRDP